jgi:hypothetical protein
MSTVKFNPQHSTIEAISNERQIKKNKEMSDIKEINAFSLQDTFTKSALLSSLETTMAETTMSVTQSEKIAQVKQKINNNELGILSKDNETRLAAARNLAQKWLAFEQQLQTETSKE